MNTKQPGDLALRGLDLRQMLPPRPGAGEPRGEWVTTIGWTAEAQADDAELLSLVAALEELSGTDDFPVFVAARSDARSE